MGEKIRLEDLVGRKVGVVFTGQGAQHPKMFLPAFRDPERYAVFLEYLNLADKTLYKDMGLQNLSTLCTPTPEEYDELKKSGKLEEELARRSELIRTTPITQSLLVECGYSYYKQFASDFQRATGTEFSPFLFAGHSVGEITALAVAEAVTYPDALMISRRRGQVMEPCGPHEKPPEGESFMAALRKFDYGRFEEFMEICEDISEGEHKVWIANYNATNSIVVSGDWQAVDGACKIAEEKGIAEKYTKLQVGNPFHTPYMEPAKEELTPWLRLIPFNDIDVGVMVNVDATIKWNGSDLRQAVLDLIPNKVLWIPITTYFREELDYILEIGPLPHLTNLFRNDPKNADYKNKAIYAGNLLAA